MPMMPGRVSFTRYFRRSIAWAGVPAMIVVSCHLLLEGSGCRVGFWPGRWRQLDERTTAGR